MATVIFTKDPKELSQILDRVTAAECPIAQRMGMASGLHGMAIPVSAEDIANLFERFGDKFGHAFEAKQTPPDSNEKKENHGNKSFKTTGNH